jgi:hypothetical protein
VVINRPHRYASGFTLVHAFFCLDDGAALVISELAKTISFPEWDKRDSRVWFPNDSGDFCVSKTPDGWLAHGPNNQTLTHELYRIAILFPTAELAQTAAELCRPTVHPALGWGSEGIDQTLAENPGPDPAVGWIGWAQVLPEYAWLRLKNAA